MDSWLNLSDSEIEDVNTARDLVTFENIQKYYSPHSEIVAGYTIGDSYTTHKRDWIGLFQSGWEDFNKYVDFQWATPEPFSQLLPMRRRFIFDAPHSKIENHLNTFQFLYISSGNEVVGVSNLFHILDLPQKSELNSDLLENALMDDEDTVIVPEPFSGFTDSVSETDMSSSFYLPFVANVLDLDEHNTVLNLYSQTESINKRLARKELPFNSVRAPQIVRFFNPGKSDDSHQPSWLQKIFTNAHSSAETFQEDVSVEETQSNSSQKTKQNLKVTFQDTTSLIQEDYEDRSWINDLEIVEKETVVEDFYDYQHPFSQFASVFMDESIEESNDFMASSIVEEFKTQITESFEHLESVGSRPNEDWQDVADAVSSENNPQYVESNTPSSYDFDLDLDLDLLFHERADGKKNRKGKGNKRRSKRKNKKYKKNAKIDLKSVQREECLEDTIDTSSINESRVTVTPTFSRPSRSCLRKRQRNYKSQNVEVPNKKAGISETSQALVPFKPKPSEMSQPFLSAPIFFPLHPKFTPTLDIVQFSSKNLLSAPYQQLEIEPIANQKRISRVQFPYFTKKHQSLAISSRQSSDCTSCKSNRKMVKSFKERSKYAEKQLGQFQNERASLQNQINLISEELRKMKLQKVTETASVAVLTDKVEDLVHTVPESNDVIQNLSENNELLELAFQSSLIDNAHLRHEMKTMKESLRILNKQFLKTASELQTTIEEIEKKQSVLESKPSCNCTNSSFKTIDDLKSILERREQWIVTLLLREDTQRHEVDMKSKDLSAMRALLENERQRAIKAEKEREELKNKMATMVASQSTSSAEDKSTWAGTVEKSESAMRSLWNITQKAVCFPVCKRGEDHESTCTVHIV